MGTSACQFLSYRMHNFTANGGPDPSIITSFLSQLGALCPQNSGASNRVALDTGSEDEFDKSYYKNLRNGKGILESGMMLPQRHLQRTTQTQACIAKSMVKMGNIEMKTGVDGETRTICSVLTNQSVQINLQMNMQNSTKKFVRTTDEANDNDEYETCMTTRSSL